MAGRRYLDGVTRVRFVAGGAAICVLAIVLALVPGHGARAAGPFDLLPDLVADPPANATFEDYAFPDGHHDLLLRFDGYVHNDGTGPLDIRASRTSASDPMPPKQRVYRSDGTTHDDDMPGAQLLYTDADGHHHWHLQDVARYSLWNQGKTAEVAPSAKVGFCLMDSEQIGPQGPAGAVYTDNAGRQFCRQGQPGALDLWEGVSAGWRDIYESWLSFQWVVVSDVQPGTYWLREDMDPDGVIHESNETNAPAYATSSTTVPGYVAKAIAAPTTPFGQAEDVTLDAIRYGTPGARQFKIVTQPAHGTLSVSSGTAFTDSTVTYTPAPGYSGSDSFTYQASDSASPYPRNPARATVTLSVGVPAPVVVIDGAPDSVETGHGVQLHAEVAHDAPGVTWSVDGVDGGDDRSGTITSDGFYTAPASVPAGGSVTIAARSASGAHDERVVAITAPPQQQPAPSPPVVTQQPQNSSRDHAVKKRRHTKIGPIAVGVAGRSVIVRVTPLRPGVLWVRARTRGKVFGGCHAKLPARRRFGCRIRAPRRLDLRLLEVDAVLKSGRKVIARRSRAGVPLLSAPGRRAARGRLGKDALAFLLCRF